MSLCRASYSSSLAPIVDVLLYKCVEIAFGFKGLVVFYINAFAVHVLACRWIEMMLHLDLNVIALIVYLMIKFVFR